MSNYFAKNKYVREFNHLTTQLFNHLTRSEDKDTGYRFLLSGNQGLGDSFPVGVIFFHRRSPPIHRLRVNSYLYSCREGPTGLRFYLEAA